MSFGQDSGEWRAGVEGTSLVTDPSHLPGYLGDLVLASLPEPLCLQLHQCSLWFPACLTYMTVCALNPSVTLMPDSAVQWLPCVLFTVPRGHSQLKGGNLKPTGT